MRRLERKITYKFDRCMTNWEEQRKMSFLDKYIICGQTDACNDTFPPLQRYRIFITIYESFLGGW